MDEWWEKWVQRFPGSVCIISHVWNVYDTCRLYYSKRIKWGICASNWGSFSVCSLSLLRFIVHIELKPPHIPSNTPSNLNCWNQAFLCVFVSWLIFCESHCIVNLNYYHNPKFLLKKVTHFFNINKCILVLGCKPHYYYEVFSVTVILAEAGSQTWHYRNPINLRWAVVPFPVWLVVQACSLSDGHSHQTQTNTDKTTLLDWSHLISHAKCIRHSLSVPTTVCDPHLLVHSISSFYLAPILPHPLHQSAITALWDEEDDPSCCAQVCFSEVCLNVCICLHEGMKGKKNASETTITEQVSFHLCRSFLTFSLSVLLAFYLRYPPPQMMHI